MTWVVCGGSAGGGACGCWSAIQPSSGGFLEATPLTSFVTMSLGAMRGGPSAEASPSSRRSGRPRRFLAASSSSSLGPPTGRPIDTNLVDLGDDPVGQRAGRRRRPGHRSTAATSCCDWLLDQQYKDGIPYTGADPAAGRGRFAGRRAGLRTTRRGPVAVLRAPGPACAGAVTVVARPSGGDAWLRTGTVCRTPGGDLGFHGARGLAGATCEPRRRLADVLPGAGAAAVRSAAAADLTAHALRAFVARGEPGLASAVAGVLHDASHFRVRRRRPASTVPLPRAVPPGHRLRPPLPDRHQRPDGSWLPLWFGNQHAADDINPVYGTARVLAAYRDLNRCDSDEARRGVALLPEVQNADGGWGGAKGTPSSVEETALAVEILLDLAPPEAGSAVERGVE